MFSWGFYILVNMALLLGATPLLDLYCYSIRNENFPVSSSYRPRLGDEADVDNLTELFEMFGTSFIV